MPLFFYLFHIIRALLFRALIFFPFECMGVLNFFPLFPKHKTPRKQIAFQAYNPQIAQVFLPIIRELEKNPDVDICFIVMFHPYHGVKGLIDTRRFARDVLGIPQDRIVMVWDACWMPLDCLVCSDVYAKFPLKKTTTVLIPHGAGMLSRWVEKNLLRKTVTDFDYYLVCGNHDKTQVEPYITDKPVLMVGGFPFVDPLVHTNRHDLSGKKVVLYAPSWGHPYAYGDVLSRSIHEVMTCLKEKDVHVLLKLHAASFVKAQAKGVCWKQRLDDYRTWENVTVVDELNDIPWFKISDILISDISSRSFNFMITDRPVILYGVPETFNTTPVESARLETMTRGAYTAKTPEELSAVIDQALHDPGRMSDSRRRVVAEVFSFPGTAARQTADTFQTIMGEN